MCVVRRVRRGLLLVTGFLCSGLVLYVLVQNGAAIWQPIVGSTAEQAQPAMPMEIPGTTLVIRNFVRYEGSYLEDGSETYEADVLGILLENTGSYGIESARVILHWDEGTYVFDVDMLPPQMSAIVLEKDRRPYVIHSWTHCTGVQKSAQEDWSDDPIAVAIMDSTKLQLTNESAKTVTEVRIYYKNYLAEDNILLGGITYSYTVAQIPPKASVTIEPYRFVYGYSRIVRIDCRRNDD